ncbi:MAG: hypothetical protein QF793_02370, partial [Candidatus Peribacteraceae bacterium]|nr:hypothetical protein [Candidatus Peribacteraceae bacterium]
VVWTKITPHYDLLSDAVRSCEADFVQERMLCSLNISSYTSVAKIFACRQAGRVTFHRKSNNKTLFKRQ